MNFQFIVRKKTPEELWKQHREEFLKIYSKEIQKPMLLSDLVKAFPDKEGRMIYRFGKDVALPVKRFGELKKYLTWLSAGISGEEMKSLIAAMEKTLVDGLGKYPNVVALGAIIQEMKKRQQMIIHTELFFNIIAVQLVREDEDPVEFDNDIHLDKVRTFKEMVDEQGAYFFFQRQELKSLTSWFSMSEQEWNQYWHESLIQQKVLPEALKLIASTTK